MRYFSHILCISIITLLVGCSAPESLTFATNSLSVEACKVLPLGESTNSRLGSISFDSQGDIIISGMFQRELQLGNAQLQSSSAGGYLAKVSKAGNVLWARLLPGYSETKLDQEDNILVAGIGEVAFFMKYTPTGRKLWSVEPRGTSGGRFVHVQNDNSYIVSGWYKGFVSLGSINLPKYKQKATFLAKLTSKGNVLWATGINSMVWQGEESYSDSKTPQLSHVLIDTEENIYLAGNFSTMIKWGDATVSSRGDTDFFIVKQNKSGKKQWLVQFGGNSSDSLQSISFDENGQILLLGELQELTLDAIPPSQRHHFKDSGGYLLSINKSGELVSANNINAKIAQAEIVRSKDSIFFIGNYESNNNKEPTIGNPPVLLDSNRGLLLAKLNTAGNFVGATVLGDTFENNHLAVDSQQQWMAFGASMSSFSHTILGKPIQSSSLSSFFIGICKLKH